eukprot:TRINITY_DN6548_c0_g1_i1.p1 TRINITY_DN6548_c0_g1~~TRINITY_DN6548_c0_g1_i1.p1  ORF type:complete len:406 (-),score=77.55 TRINITY_DN6548_c0_g1_i1:165-1382(-)
MKDRGAYQRTFAGPKLVLPQRTADPPQSPPKPQHTTPTVINAVVRTSKTHATTANANTMNTNANANMSTNANTNAMNVNANANANGSSSPMSSASPLPPYYVGFHASPPRIKGATPFHADDRRAKYLSDTSRPTKDKDLTKGKDLTKDNDPTEIFAAARSPNRAALNPLNTANHGSKHGPIGPESPQRRLYKPFRECPIRSVDKQINTEQIGSALILDQKDWSSHGHSFSRSKRYTAISPVVSHMPDINPEADYAQDQFTVDRSVKETMRKYGPSFHSKLPRTEENKMETAEHIGPGSYEVDVQPRPRYVHTQDWVFRSTIPRASPKRISAAVTTEPVYYSVADDERHRHRRAVTMPKSPRFATRTTNDVPGPGTYIDPLQWGPKQINTFVTQTNMQTTRTHATD